MVGLAQEQQPQPDPPSVVAVPMACLHCGRTFLAARPRKYCRPSCRKAAYWRRHHKIPKRGPDRLWYVPPKDSQKAGPVKSG